MSERRNELLVMAQAVREYQEYQKRIEDPSIRSEIMSTLSTLPDLVARAVEAEFGKRAREFWRDEVQAMRESLTAEVVAAIRALPAPEIYVPAQTPPVVNVKNEVNVPPAKPQRRTVERDQDGKVTGWVDEET